MSECGPASVVSRCGNGDVVIVGDHTEAFGAVATQCHALVSFSHEFGLQCFFARLVRGMKFSQVWPNALDIYRIQSCQEPWYNSAVF